MNKDKPKVIVVGLDGATFKNLKPWMEEGLLPNLSYLILNGSSGRLRSTLPNLSSPAWTSFMTGVNPGKHGVFGFVKPFRSKDYKKELTSSKDIKAKTIFEILSEEGKMSGVVNLPMTYPAFKINGFMIGCGLTTPSTDVEFTYPADLFEKAGLKKSEYILNIGAKIGSTHQKDKFFSDLMECTEKRKNAAFKLMDLYNWDLFVIVFSGTDWLQHFFWHHIDPSHPKYNPEEAEKFMPLIRSYYKKMDSIIGDFMSKLDDETSLFIVSDHGFGSDEKAISFHRLLEQNGLLHYKKEPAKVRIKNLLHKVSGALDRNFSIYRNAKSLIKRIAFNVRGRIEEKGSPKSGSALPAKGPVSSEYLYWRKIDWQKTVAYAGYTTNAVNLNLAGREPEGLVRQGEDYQNAKREIINLITNLNKPGTKEKLKVEVFDREKIYSGPYAKDGYDLCVEIEDGRYVLRNYALSKSIFSESKEWTGTHTKDGIFIAFGNNIKKNHPVNGASIMDIAPTVLRMLGAPVSEEMDGKVLENIFSAEFMKISVPSYKRYAEREEKKDADTEDMALTEKRLADLGYI